MCTTPQLVSLAKDYEVRHWMRTLNCTQSELYEAVMAVGPSLEDVREYRSDVLIKSMMH